MTANKHKEKQNTRKREICHQLTRTCAHKGTDEPKEDTPVGYWERLADFSINVKFPRLRLGEEAYSLHACEERSGK